jgi:hypothetical protein
VIVANPFLDALDGVPSNLHVVFLDWRAGSGVRARSSTTRRSPPTPSASPGARSTSGTGTAWPVPTSATPRGARSGRPPPTATGTP